MFNDRRPLGLKLVIALAIINSLVTGAYFFLLGQGILEGPGFVQPLWTFAATLTIGGILPTVIGAYGLYLKRLWGLSFFVFGCGAYLSMALLVLLTAFKTSGMGIMFFISIYIIIYILIAVLYSWSFRHHLSEF